MKEYLIKALGVSITFVSICLLIVLSVPKDWILADSKISYGLPNKLSEQAQHQVQLYSNRWPQLASLSLVSFDFSKNQRVTVMRVTPDPYTKQVLDARDIDADTPIPIFTNNVNQNHTMETIIGGQFACEQSKKSPWVKSMFLDEYLVNSCRTPIDPTVGRVAGYLVLHFKSQMTPADLARLQKDTQLLATMIYFDDVPR